MKSGSEAFGSGRDCSDETGRCRVGVEAARENLDVGTSKLSLLYRLAESRSCCRGGVGGITTSEDLVNCCTLHSWWSHKS